jgi:hypothetical protein
VNPIDRVRPLGSSAPLLVLSLWFAGCASDGAARELPAGHPARPEAAAAPAEPALNVFALTPTYALPRAEWAGATGTTGMGMTGMGAHGTGATGTGAGMQHEHAAPPAGDGAQQAVRYVCPMHPAVVRSEPGKCPECGMALRREVVHEHDGGEERR